MTPIYSDVWGDYNDLWGVTTVTYGADYNDLWGFWDFLERLGKTDLTRTYVLSMLVEKMANT